MRLFDPAGLSRGEKLLYGRWLTELQAFIMTASGASTPEELTGPWRQMFDEAEGSFARLWADMPPVGTAAATGAVGGSAGTDTSPCAARDGNSAVGDDGCCVGCDKAWGR